MSTGNPQSNPQSSATVGAKVITYRPPGFCQLQLPSRDRIIISCARTGIRVYKLTFFGLIPARVIGDWPVAHIDKAIEAFYDPGTPTASPLDAIKARLERCATLSEVERLCAMATP